MQTPKTIGKYKLIRRLGRGGMGEVWLAYCEEIEKSFVLKLLLPELAKKPDHRRRFLREAKLVAQLPHEGGIVPVVDYGEASGRLFIVMPFIDGINLQTLTDTLAESGIRLPYTVIAYIVSEILEALQQAHTHMEEGILRAVIHRDVKPSNVLISSRGGVFLTDFGIALQDNDLSMGAFGTLAYVAPEQARGRGLPIAQNDIFGVGGITHFLLTGEPPRLITAIAELEAKLDQPPPLTGLEDVPQALENFRVAALDPFEDSRIASAAEGIALFQGKEGCGDYRESKIALAALCQRVAGGMHSGMTEMRKAARSAPKRVTRTLPVDNRGRPIADKSDGQLWWGADDDAPAARVPRPEMNLKGVPPEYIPQPEGEVEEDAPRVRHRPRRTPSQVQSTEHLDPPEARPEPGIPCVGETERLDPPEGEEEGGQ